MKFKCKNCGYEVEHELLVPESQVREIMKNKGGVIKLWCNRCESVTRHTIVGEAPLEETE